MSIINEHIPFYREIFGLTDFWKEKFFMIGLPYIEGDRLPADFNYKNLKELAKRHKLKKVYSVDLFDSNADFSWDLNLPVPVRYHNAFNTVIDIGTLEHIFDTRTCLENYLRLVKPGGLFALVTPVNGYFGHGLHVFNPQGLIDAVEQNNFIVIYKKFITSTGMEISDPSLRRNILLWLVARKKKPIKKFFVPQQMYWKDVYSSKSSYYPSALFRNAENRATCCTDEGEETNFSGPSSGIPHSLLCGSLLKNSLLKEVIFQLNALKRSVYRVLPVDLRTFLYKHF